MNTYFRYLSVCALSACLITPQAHAQMQMAPTADRLSNTYTDSGSHIDTEHDRLHIDYTVRPFHLESSQTYIIVTTRLTSADGLHSVPLDTFCVAGNARYRIFSRQALLRPKTLPLAYSKIRSARAMQEQPLSFSHRLPLAPWMKYASIKVEEQTFGCAACGISKETATLMTFANPTPKYELDRLRFDFHTPIFDPNALAQVEFSSRVHFEVDRAEIQRRIADNDRQLNRIDSFINHTLKVKYGTLRQLDIRSYASPEAPEQHNLELTNRRAQALQDYIRHQFPEILRLPTTCRGMGEDWDGFLSALDTYTGPEAEHFRKLVRSNVSNRDGLEWLLHNVGDGSAYIRMRDALYPPLRRSQLTASFSPHRPSDSQLPEAYRNEAQVLSHADLYRYAEMVADPDKRLEVLHTAYRRFAATEPIAALNYAAQLVRMRRGEEARRVLAPLTRTAETDYLTAASYVADGQMQQADEWMRRAAEAGYPEAIRQLQATK